MEKFRQRRGRNGGQPGKREMPRFTTDRIDVSDFSLYICKYGYLWVYKANNWRERVWTTDMLFGLIAIDLNLFIEYKDE